MENTTMPTPETATPKKNASQIGKYTIVDLKEFEAIRDIWKNEAQDFTTWMSRESVMERLGEALEFNKSICDIKTECTSGPSERRCDIVARLHSEDDDDEAQDEILAIENQLEKTDFSHLGRVILYAALNNATRIVWVVKDATYDHRKAIAWLNENTTDRLRFYLVEVIVYDMEDNRVAPIFRLVEGPDEERKVQQSGTPRQKRNIEFWQGFLDFLNKCGEGPTCERNRLKCINSFRQPTGDNWYGVSIGTGKCHIDLWDSHNRVDFSIQTYEQETFRKIKSIMPEITKALGIKEDGDYFGKEDAIRPRVRFAGPSCGIEKGSAQAKNEAYGWLMRCLETLVPKIQKVLKVK